MIGLDDQLAGGAGVGRRHLDLAEGAPRLAPLLAHRAEFADAPHVALAPRGDAVAHPVLLGDDAPVELVPFGLLLLEDSVAPGLEGSEALLQPARRAAIEPDGRAGDVGQQALVVADQHEGGAGLGELLLQPFDRDQIEMIGRLVEQQHLGHRRQRAHQRRAARLPARQRGRPRRRIDAEFLHQRPRAIGIVLLAEAGEDEIGDRREGGEIRLLLEIAHLGAGLREPAAAVRLDVAGGDLQQRRLARPVAPDQRDPFARGDRQFRPVEKGMTAERQVDVSQLQKRRHMKEALNRLSTRLEASPPKGKAGIRPPRRAPNHRPRRTFPSMVNAEGT